MTKEDIFMTGLYDQLHDSPMQRKFKKIHPWPVGTVFIKLPGMSEEEIREHFRMMKRLGFTCLKQLCLHSDDDEKKIMHMALDEGIIPWWCDEGGWEDPTPELLEFLGISPEISIEELRNHPVWLKRQDSIMRHRIDLGIERVHMTASNSGDGLPGTLKKFEYGLPEEMASDFVSWLKEQYKTVDNLKLAWNFNHTLIRSRPWETWEEVEQEVIPLINKERQEYRRIRDVLRFKTDLYLAGMEKKMRKALEQDPNMPLRAGGEMSLFLPMAMFSTDMEAIAELMKEGGSYYPSIHLSWHFEEVDFEDLRPVYMQASIATDWFKGGWAATWESTGGPQQFTGGKGIFYEPVRDQTPGFTVDENTMTQLMLSWVAGGFKGFGLWSWNTRTAGWEAGEYGLLDSDNQITERAIIAGKIGSACQRLRDELWEARKEPVVGIFYDWDMESIWAAASVGGREHFRSMPVFARIGVSRAMINKNVPWEHITAKNIRSGLAPRYKSIILPACLAIDEELLPILKEYVEQGGRLVLDAPGGWFDYFGRLLNTSQGSDFEQLFGVRIANLQYSNPISRPWKIQGHLLEGTTMDLVPTSAVVTVCFDDGKPAVTEKKLGRGSAVVMGYQASLMCKKPGNLQVETWLMEAVLGTHKLPYACNECIVYRLAASGADHYFLLNDGEAVRAYLHTGEYRYASAEDPVSGEKIRHDEPIDVPGYGGRWIRMIKAER